MSKIQINLIAVEVRKWDLETQKISMRSYYILNEEEKNITFDVTILQPPEMVEEFLGKLRFESEQTLSAELDEEIQVDFDNETFLRQKLYNYFKRITMELNNPKRRKGQPKMIFTTHMDIYNENQDVSFLPRKMQFYVVLNWARKYYEREDYKRAVEPLRKLITVAPEYGLGYKWLARSLKKIRKYEEAMHYYEKYALVDGSVDAWLDLAKSYRKGKIFDKSEEIYHQILKDDPKNKEARIGLAQIKYATKDEGYLNILDELHEEDPEWLKEWLVDEFNFRIYVPEKTLLSPNQTAKFLGFSQIFELTQRAFKNEIPSHFNPSKAKLSFYKEEIENWAMVMNRYHCLPEEIKLYPDKINVEMLEGDREEAAIEEEKDKKTATATNNKPGTSVEEILMQIRARKAQRNNSNQNKTDKGETSSKTGKRGRPKKKKATESSSEEITANSQSQVEDTTKKATSTKASGQKTEEAARKASEEPSNSKESKPKRQSTKKPAAME